MRGCAAELCENWTGDGLVCPCALFDLDRSRPVSDAADYYEDEGKG